MEKENKVESSISLTIKSVLLGLGFYYFIRIIRNNYYFPIITPLETTNPPVFQILRYLGHLLFIFGLLIYFHFVRKDRHCLSYVKFNPKDCLKIILGLIIGFAFNGLNILIAFLHGDIDMVKSTFNVALIFVSFFAVGIQSFAEEMHYRMWVQKRIVVGAPIIYAVIGSAFAFAWSHMLNDGVTFVALINLMLHGVIYALMTEITGSIWLTGGLHTAWNFTQNFVFGLPNSGYPAILTMMAPTYTKDSICYDSTFGVEGTMVGTVINVVVLIIVYLIYKNKNRVLVSNKKRKK